MTRTAAAIAAGLLLLPALPVSLAAQDPARDADPASQIDSIAAPADSVPKKGSFVSGWIGGTLGSIGGGVILGSLAENDCYECYDEAFAFWAGSIIGSSIGAYTAVKMSGGRPSGFGSAIGATLGAMVALGVAATFAEDGDEALVLISYTITQGAAAALGAGQF